MISRGRWQSYRVAGKLKKKFHTTLKNIGTKGK